MNQQEFKELNNKILPALKEHPNIIKEGVNVIQQKHPFYGDVFVIGTEAYAVSNNGDVAEWKRVQ